MSAKQLLVLDSLFDDLDVERSVAAGRGWDIFRWDGSPAQLATADAVVHVRTRVDAALIAQLTQCRVIGRFGVGLDSVDQPAAAQHRMAVVNVRDYCVPEMTAHTLALAFALARRLSGWRNEEWIDVDWQSFRKARPVSGRTRVSIIGMGTIGSAVAGALQNLGFDVTAVTTKGRATARRMGLAVVPLETGLLTADFVFLHTALDATTANLIDRRALSMLPAGAVLVNTARLGLLDEGAVAEALATERLSGLGLDARLPADSPLRQFASDSRVLVTPHVGWYSERSARVLRERAIMNTIDAYGAGAGRKAS